MWHAERVTLAPLLVAVLGLASSPGPLAGWRLAGRFAAEQAVYDARCAATIDDLCRALGIEQEGYLEITDGELRYRGDAECWDLPFRAERVERDRAEGSFERRDPGGAPPAAPCAGDACAGRRVQIWLEGETLIVRGAIDRLGACAPPDRDDALETTLRRFVPVQRLKAAAAERAARLGVDLRRCDSKTSPGAGPPRRCWDDDWKRCGNGLSFGCSPVSQGRPGPAPTVCGCVPDRCPEGAFIVVGGASGTWPDGSAKGTFACSAHPVP